MKPVEAAVMASIFTFLHFVGTAYGTAVNISNTEPRFDTNNLEMDIHDGNIVQWHPGGLYYFYGMGYQNCTQKNGLIPPYQCPGIYEKFGQCGFRTDHAVRVYTSKDLASWTLVSENALPVAARPYGIYFRPKVIYNTASAQYLLWINILRNASTPLEAYPDASYLVAAAPTPEGPFAVVTEKVSMSQTGGGDFDVIVDPNNRTRAYIAYDAWENGHRIMVQELSSNFSDVLGDGAKTDFLTPKGNEAPIFFERQGWYYILYGPTCCFCKEGSGANVLVSSAPLGPWVSMNVDLNPKLPNSMDRTIAGQNSFNVEVTLASGAVEMLFVSDRWSSAPDHLKSHDLQYWQPLLFNDSAKPPTIAVFEWRDWFVLQMPPE